MFSDVIVFSHKLQHHMAVIPQSDNNGVLSDWAMGQMWQWGSYRPFKWWIYANRIQEPLLSVIAITIQLQSTVDSEEPSPFNHPGVQTDEPRTKNQESSEHWRLFKNKQNGLAHLCWTQVGHKIMPFQEWLPVDRVYSHGPHQCKQFIKGKPIIFVYKLWSLVSFSGYL